MKTKVINLRTIENDEKLSAAFCKKVLNQNGNDYSDKEILRIRDYLYQLAEIEARNFNQWRAEQATKIIKLNSDNHETAKSYSLHQSKYRRTG